jgi:hypothetical protein
MHNIATFKYQYKSAGMVVLCYGSDLEEEQRPYNSTKQRGATAKQQSLVIPAATNLSY